MWLMAILQNRSLETGLVLGTGADLGGVRGVQSNPLSKNSKRQKLVQI